MKTRTIPRRALGIKDVAHRAGVSISTVSNVLRGSKAVSEDLARQVMRAVEELNYTPNPIASGLKSKSTMSIAVAVTDIHRIFFPQVIKGIDEICSKYGYLVTVCNTNANLLDERRIVRNLVGNWVDGIILDSMADPAEHSYLEELAALYKGERLIPCVSLERDFQRFGIDSVVVDNHRGGVLAAQHLLECGSQRFLFIAGNTAPDVHAARLRGFAETLVQAGHALPPDHLLYADSSPASGHQIVRDVLQRDLHFDAIFATTDQLAIGAIKALREVGIRIPEDVRVIGFDNTFISSFTEPSLTTIHVPKHQMGTRAAECLLQRIANPAQPPSCVQVPIRLIIRNSTDLRGDRSWDLVGW